MIIMIAIIPTSQTTTIIKSTSKRTTTMTQPLLIPIPITRAISTKSSATHTDK